MVFLLDALQLCVPPDHRAKIWPQISYHMWCARCTAFSRLSVPFLTAQHFRPSLPTLFYCGNHTRRFPVFVRLVWNGSTVQTNLQLAICRFSTCCVRFLHTIPASSAFGRPSVTRFETSLSGAHSQSASIALCSRSRRSVNLLSTLLDASAHLQYLRGSSNRLCTDNTRSPRLHRRGGNAERYAQVHMCLVPNRQRQLRREKNYNPIQADTTFKPTAATPNLTHQPTGI